jgi:hypothetical protein
VPCLYRRRVKANFNAALLAPGVNTMKFRPSRSNIQRQVVAGAVNPNEAGAADAALRQRVEALPRTHEPAGSFLNRPAEHGRR